MNPRITEVMGWHPPVPGNDPPGPGEPACRPRPARNAAAGAVA